MLPKQLAMHLTIAVALLAAEAVIEGNLIPGTTILEPEYIKSSPVIKDVPKHSLLKLNFKPMDGDYSCCSRRTCVCFRKRSARSIHNPIGETSKVNAKLINEDDEAKPTHHICLAIILVNISISVAFLICAYIDSVW